MELTKPVKLSRRDDRLITTSNSFSCSSKHQTFRPPPPFIFLLSPLFLLHFHFNFYIYPNLIRLRLTTCSIFDSLFRCNCKLNFRLFSGLFRVVHSLFFPFLVLKASKGESLPWKISANEKTSKMPAGKTQKRRKGTRKTGGK